MPEDLLVDPVTLREQVRDKYRDVALAPNAAHHFHTGRGTSRAAAVVRAPPPESPL